MITSRVSCHGHSAVVLQFFETVVRYDKFFTCEPHHIPDVLVSLEFLEKQSFMDMKISNIILAIIFLYTCIVNFM